MNTPPKLRFRFQMPFLYVGRFYLQVGYNEYFALGQSAWCGAQYEPQDTVEERVDNSIAVLDNLGQTVLRIAPEAKRSDSGKKQVTAVVQQLCQLAQEEKIPVRSLWKDPLPNRLDVSEQGQMPKTPVQAYLGRLDDPSRQKQFPLFFDFEHCQNLMMSERVAAVRRPWYKVSCIPSARTILPARCNSTYWIIPAGC